MPVVLKLFPSQTLQPPNSLVSLIISNWEFELNKKNIQLYNAGTSISLVGGLTFLMFNCIYYECLYLIKCRKISAPRIHLGPPSLKTTVIIIYYNKHTLDTV